MTPGFASQLEQQDNSSSVSLHSQALWLKAALMTVLIWAVFWDSLTDMAHDWWTVPAYSQGMLLPPLALYVAWLNRRQILSLAATPDNRGLLLTALACVMFVLGRVSSEFFMMRFSFVILLAGLTWTFWGLPRLRVLGFPLLLLGTMVPLPVMVYNSLAAPLQLLASDLAAQIAQGVGVSVFRDGNILQLAGVTLGVAEACSGLNSLSALIVGSVLLGYLSCSALSSRVILFLAAAPLAVVVNILRVAGTAILADYHEEFAMGFYHTFSGWLVFVAGFSLLYLLASILHSVLDSK